MITAVSTLVAEFLENDFSLEESEAIVSQYLSLPEDIDLSSFEPLREVFNDGEKAKTFVLRATQLSNLFNEGSRFLQMKSGNKLDRISSAEKLSQP